MNRLGGAPSVVQRRSDQIKTGIQRFEQASAYSRLQKILRRLREGIRSGVRGSSSGISRRGSSKSISAF